MELLSTLGVDWKLIIAQLINFGILLAVLSYFVYRPVLRVLDDRRERIRKSMEDAKALERKVKDMEKERHDRLAQMDSEAQQFLDKAKKQAEATKKDMVESAQREVDQMLEKGQKQLDDERKKLLAEVQQTVTDVSLTLASKLLQKEFSDADQKRLLQGLEKDLPSMVR